MTKWKSLFFVLLVHVLFLWGAVGQKPLPVPKVAHKIKVQTIIHTPPPASAKPSLPKKPKAAPKIAVPKPIPSPKKIVAKNPEKPKNTVDIVPPAPIKQLNVESEMDQGALAHLVAVMQETLALPEVGEVKIELTITSEGKVTELKVISSHSELNRHYLEATLPGLTFPLREKGLFQHDTQTFVFAFHSVI